MQEGVVATSYAAGDKFYIDPMKLLPMERFLPQPKGAPSRGGAPPALCPLAPLSRQCASCKVARRSLRLSTGGLLASALVSAGQPSSAGRLSVRPC